VRDGIAGLVPAHVIAASVATAGSDVRVTEYAPSAVVGRTSIVSSVTNRWPASAVAGQERVAWAAAAAADTSPSRTTASNSAAVWCEYSCTQRVDAVDTTNGWVLQAVVACGN